jgi:hypothetical protein
MSGPAVVSGINPRRPTETAVKQIKSQYASVDPEHKHEVLHYCRRVQHGGV